MKTVPVIFEESGYCEGSENFNSTLMITRNAPHGKICMSMQIPKEQKDLEGNDLFLYRCSIDEKNVHESMFSLDTLVCMYHLIEAQLRVYGIEATQLELVETPAEEQTQQ